MRRQHRRSQNRNWQNCACRAKFTRRILPTDKKLGYDAKMKRIIHVRIFRGEKYFLAECCDLPVVTQAATLDELMKNVKEAIALQLEGENPAAFGLAPDASILASYELETEPQAHA
jgi:predicted RNase H-like HicB family nuclease